MSYNLLYNYNSDLQRFKDLHDETGGKLKEFEFKYYDCFCGGEQYRIVANATRHRNHFDIVQCATCGTLRINPYLSDASIEKYYKEIYGPVKRKDISPEALFKRQSQSSAALFGLLSPYLSKDSKILDYGSGAGGRMEKFQAEGFDVSLHDYDRNYLEYGLNKGMKEYAEGRKYDAMILSHVLEHINHPVEFLRSIAAFINDKGLIYIEVPLMENTKKLLHDLHLAHKFYFTRESLTHLAGMAGFVTVADLPNAILVTRGKTKDASLPARARKKSDAYLGRVMKKENWAMLKTRVRAPFKKKSARK